MPTTLPPPRPFDHPIVLVGEMKLINILPYQYAHFQKRKIERQVNEMLKSGLIRSSTSPFSSLVLLVRKKNKSQRFCKNYRTLNETMVNDRFSVPSVDKMLDELHGARVFSKLDLRANYQKICLREKDVHKETFRTHFGYFE